MARKRPARIGNPDLRQQKHIPAPPIEEIEKQIFSLLSPLNFKPLKSYEHKPGQEPEQKKKWRDRILTLPVMMAIVVSLVYRQIPGLREVIRVLSQEGLLWVEPMLVSTQALSKRLRTLPIELFAQIFEQVMARISTQPKNQAVLENWQPVCAKFTAIWIADGSTLEALRRKLKALQGQQKTLAGKIMIVVEAFHHHPVYHFSQAILCGEASDTVPYLVEHQKLFGLVKTRRKRHRQIDAYTQQIWALSS
ncbi:hypothetical protein [uncultured Nostoc sp.]|uniref:hypothetical protein n=1 Tax=uncultured Nostoc sp. TaxID=340711 RepID=UPI0035C972FB